MFVVEYCARLALAINGIATSITLLCTLYTAVTGQVATSLFYSIGLLYANGPRFDDSTVRHVVDLYY